MKSDFFIFFIFLGFFIFLAFAFIGSLAFMVSCAAGPVVWAEATDTLPTRAAQHTATMRRRILISCLVKERPITCYGRKSSLLGTQRDIRDICRDGGPFAGEVTNEPEV